jgi:DNA-binding MarR family transcriptional regulator
MPAKNDFLIALEKWAGIYLFRSLTEFFNFLKPTGISMQQAYALTYIYYNGPSKISQLCDHMMVTAAAASQMVDRLEKQNLVKRTAEPEDRRVRPVVLTDSGKGFVIKSIEARQHWVKEIPAALSEKQQDQISAALKLLVSIYPEKLERIASK